MTKSITKFRDTRTNLIHTIKSTEKTAGMEIVRTNKNSFWTMSVILDGVANGSLINLS